MNAQNHQETHAEQTAQPQKVRNIPIFVEGRDKPVINDNLDSASHFGDTTRPAYTQPPLDNTYFAEEAPPMYQPPPNMSKAFGPPFGKNYRQGTQPFAQQKVYPQSAAYARGSSPGRAQSPRPADDIKIPVHHDAPKHPQQKPQPQPPKPQQQQQPPPQQPQQQQPPPEAPSPPPAARPQPLDPITQILAIQTDVLNLMTEVEKFTGTKKDKRYIFLDEMLTRNLIKLDNIETEGKENIRNARKEAIKCIQKCIAVLEAKAESNANMEQPQQAHGADEDTNAEGQTQNGEVDINEAPKEDPTVEQTVESEQRPQEQPSAGKEAPQAADTRPDNAGAKTGEVDKKPKKATKNAKKRDKSKDKSDERVEPMQVDEKGEKSEPQQMEVDGAASQ